MKPVILWRNGYWRVAYSGEYKRLSNNEKQFVLKAHRFITKLNNSYVYSKLRERWQERQIAETKQCAERLEKRRQEALENLYFNS